MELDLPLPGVHLKDAHNTSFFDLTPHPWAGLPSRIPSRPPMRQGQIGKSETQTVTLPERQFPQPLRARPHRSARELTVHPADRDVVAET